MTEQKKILDIIAASKLLSFIGLALIAWLMHFCALYFIFPGYYHPLSFHHSDFYIPAAFVYAPGNHYSFASLLHWPRPLFMCFYKFTGYFGYAGSIAWVVAIVFFNCALTALLFARLLTLKVDGKFYLLFALYCFLLFTQPYFYTFYSQDIGSQLSYLLLLVGAFIFFALNQRQIIWAALALLVLSTSAFLVKETYILSIGFVTFCWFVFYLKKDLIKAIAPGVAVFIAAIISILFNLKAKSVFVNLNARQGSDYDMNLNLASILQELKAYAGQGLTPLVIIALGFIAFVIYKKSKNKLPFAGFFICIGFAVLAWLPNALLPFHHYQGYSFNGLYVCFSVLFIVFKLMQNQELHQRLFLIILMLLLISPLSSIKKYRDDRNQWVLAMEGVQKNLLASFQQATAQLLPLNHPVKVLITGISSPFHPFAFPESIRSFPGGDNASYYFVVPKEFPVHLGETVDLVKFISDAERLSVIADQEWQFDQNGKLVAIIQK